jgi:hypothetical protein
VLTRARPRQSYGEQLLIVGDAAGQIDPLTGEGIHLAMLAAREAASTILGMLESGDLSAARAKAYHSAWWSLFGSDFPISSLVSAAGGGPGPNAAAGGRSRPGGWCTRRRT